MSDDHLLANHHLKVSEEEYVNEYLPLFKTDITKLLTLKPGQYSTVSFQEVHCRTYKCAGNQLSETLLKDVRETIVSFVRESFVDSNTYDHISFMKVFNEIAGQYLFSVQHVATAFTFLNKSFVEGKLHTNLLALFNEDLHLFIIKPLYSRLVDSFDLVRSQPFVLDPAITSGVVWTLYMLNTDYVKMAPDIFAQHIPNLTAPTREEDIPVYMDETQRVQRQLVEEGYSRSRATSKRPLEMDTDNPCEGSNKISP